MSPLMEMHDGIHAQIHQLLASCLQNHCIQDHVQKDRGASIGASRVQALVPRPAGRARNVWPIRTAPQSSRESCWRTTPRPPSMATQRWRPHGTRPRARQGASFGGERFPSNIYQSPFPSRFKRREYNLRIVQLQISASAVVLMHELVQVLVCKQSEQSTLAARDLAR